MNLMEELTAEECKTLNLSLITEKYSLIFILYHSFSIVFINFGSKKRVDQVIEQYNGRVING